MKTLQELEEAYNKLGEEIQALKNPTFEPFWEPTNQIKAWFIDHSYIANISDAYSWNADEIATGRAFETKELAQKALDYKLAEQRLRKAVWNLNKGPAPAFEVYTGNWTILIEETKIVTDCFVEYKVNPDWLWLHTKELTEQLIESHKNDLSIYFHGI